MMSRRGLATGNRPQFRIRRSTNPNNWDTHRLRSRSKSPPVMSNQTVWGYGDCLWFLDSYIRGQVVASERYRVYRAEAIVAAVRRRLASNPMARLGTLSIDLKIDRHTICRAIKRLANRTFEDLRVDSVNDEVHRLLQQEVPLSQKEMATRLGCSSKTMSRLIQAHETSRTRRPRMFPVDGI